jgi:hypothetical protein
VHWPVTREKWPCTQGRNAGNLAVVSVAFIALLLAFDLFPGLATLLAVLVGGAGRGASAGRLLPGLRVPVRGK